MRGLILPYREAKTHIMEGDVLLFRGKSWVSKIISSQTDTTYSHVGIASWVNGSANTDEGQLECVEFREWKGGRAVNLEVAVQQYPECIDVYRPIPVFGKIVFDKETKEVKYLTKEFNGKAVTRTMRRMTGLPYGWKRIWWMTKKKLLFFRFFSKGSLMNDKLRDIVYPVCSTSVAYAFNYNDFDLLSNKADEWMEPGHIALSPRLNYLFTLGV